MDGSDATRSLTCERERSEDGIALTGAVNAYGISADYHVALPASTRCVARATDRVTGA